MRAASTGRQAGLVAGLVVLLGAVAVDVLSGVQLTGAYATSAIVASMLTDSRRTAVVAALAVIAALLGGIWHDNAGTRDWLVRAGICTVLAALAVLSAVTRERRERRLRQMTVIAETAQHAVLRAMPTAIGSVGFAARYISAAEEALVGGDLYEVAATPFGVRAIVGDVRGKGRDAVQTAASVLGAFRQAAFTEPDVASLARAIDVLISKLITEEEFITAVLVEFGPHSVSVANCGHHPPLLLSADRPPEELVNAEPTLPLGMGATPTPTRHTEARDKRGVFFPLGTHADQLTAGPLEDVLDELVSQLTRFTGRGLGDDLSLVLLENRPSLADS